jgi:hypothetical protein
MSEWLGKPNLEDKDLPSHFRALSLYIKYFTDNQRARVSLLFPRDIQEKFQQAIVKTYGTFSAGNVIKATEEAVRMWIDHIENQR